MQIETPLLNWREIAAWVDTLRPRIIGRFVERVYVPERTRFRAGYLKGEWALKLAEFNLVFSIRARHPYFALYSGKELKACTKATQSGFGMALSKHLKGLKLESIEALERDRIVILNFSEIRLVISLIPALPEAHLVDKDRLILSQSRTLENPPTHFEFPAPRKAPEMEIKNPAVHSIEKFRQAVETGLEAEAFELRIKEAERSVKEVLKDCGVRLKQCQTAIREAEKEPQWQNWGNLLKASMGTLPQQPPRSGGWKVYDFETGDPLELPVDPKLTLSQQVEKFYQNAKRKIRRIEEAQTRARRFEEKKTQLTTLTQKLPEFPDWARLQGLELALGLGQPERGAPKLNKKTGTWLGKTFQSEGFMILVGRSKDENLELTFKHARGNDLWLHVRGKPGAHVVIPLHSGKSPSLQTLLDAANLAVYYSGGEKWGKTEVDYTLKKNVKRIKDSSEASYTHNKTLMIEVDGARIQKLTSQNS